MSNEEYVTGARRGQDDLIRCIQMFLMRKIPFSEAGVAKCVQEMRDNGEGNREFLSDPVYLKNTVRLAHGVIEEIDVLRRK